jgi:hypothetical protein
VDFGKILSQQKTAAPLEPRELWASLPEKAKGYGYLRDVQGQVLAAWYERRHERDLVLKVNTGGGKTIDGLIILSSYLNAGEGPALYVTPDKYLAHQVRAEASRLGLPTVDDPDSPRYLRGEAIAVANIHKLVNGRSVFASARASGAPAPIGSVVIDDAHAAVATTRAQFSIRLEREHPAFGELLALFRDDLEVQSPNGLLELDDQSYSALLAVPFWAWYTKLARAREILHRHSHGDPLTFAWPAVRDVLGLCRAVFTGLTLTITPPCPPIRQITSFRDARHRVYLTATLADDSVLVTDFNADADSVRRPITPLTAGDIGERMILAPEEINPGLDAHLVRDAIAELAADRNVVVLVPSLRAANAWRAFTSRIVLADDIARTVAALRGGHVGLVVLVNKYDGIDLPDDACRVLVLDGLPEVATGDERLESQVLRHAGTDDRQVQRIEQGMGRAVRSNEDHCVVFLIGPRLSQLVADPRSFGRFGPATQAQLELSRTVQGDLIDAPLAGIMKVAAQALNRDPDWVRLAKVTLAAIPAPEGFVSGVAIARRQAFELATDGDYRAAAEVISAAVDTVAEPRVQGWLLEQKAAYLQHVDPTGAQDTLAAARGKNPSVTRPLVGVRYQRLAGSADQAQQAVNYLVARYSNSTDLRLGLQAIADDLIFDVERTEELEEAFRLLGLHLGFGAQRPEKELGVGPDVLWALGGSSYWVIEAKSGATSQVIHKRDANQLAGSMNWFREKYDQTSSALPVMVHHARRMARDATAPAGMRVVMEDGLRRLRQACVLYAAGLASGRWDGSANVNAQLVGHHLRAGDMATYLRHTQAAT